MALTRRSLLAAAMATPVALAARPAAAHAAPRAPTPVGARPYPPLTSLFDDYSDSGVGWTGADSTYSVALPDGRVVWIFSDTFLGPVDADGGRPRDTPFLNNSFVVQRGTRLTTVHGGTANAPEALLPPPDDTRWFWAGAGMLGTGTLDVVYHQFHRFGTGIWDFGWEKDVLARFALPSLRLLDVTGLPSGPKVTSGSWLAPPTPPHPDSPPGDVGFTYVYRVEDLGADKYLHVARVRGRDLRRPWSYFTGTGWSAGLADSGRVLVGVSNEYSVTRAGPWYVLVTQDTTELFSRKIVAYFGRSPVGPFEHRTLLYETPETGADGSYHDANVYTYNPHVHPHLSTPSRWIVSYNVNSFVSDDLYADVSIYRPRFVEVRLEP